MKMMRLVGGVVGVGLLGASVQASEFTNAVAWTQVSQDITSGVGAPTLIAFGVFAFLCLVTIGFKVIRKGRAG